MTLHLVRLPVSLRALSTFAVAKGISDDDGGYALHRALRDRLGAAGPQPFRFLPEHRGGPQLLGYAADGPAFGDAASLPIGNSLLRDVFTGAAEVQAMPDSWRAGARYAFDVRVRPVVRYGKTRRAARAGVPGAWQNRAGEIDAFVAACERAGEGVPVDREQVYRDWLDRRLAGAATVEAAELRLLRRTRTRRALHDKPGGAAAGGGDVQGRKPRFRVSEGPDAVMGGLLTVTDPAAFAQLLARGVGRHAAFGYGMLLLSPPGRAA